MMLPPGIRLGVYEIISPAGAGGMGEVYRARDTRLDRTVAIKVLPSALAGSEELRERFEREARAISSLQHPNICALFDVGETFDSSPSGPGIRYLVLEFLEGETLAARLARLGAVPLADALRIAIDICDALDAAHRANIVHRDLKPANVFLARSPSGSGSPTAKLLDFGLAKAATPVVASGASVLATTPPTLTAQGTILGTFQYMAPEQIEGLEADVRTDIFAFGALLFEMLTGRPAFAGKTRATLLGSILKDNPPAVSALDPTVPKAIDHVIERCVAKDPADRWQSARDVLHELDWIASGGATASLTSAQIPARPRRWNPWLALASVAVVSLGLGAALPSLWRRAPSAEPVQFMIESPPDTTFASPAGGGTGLATQIAVSPDGKSIVFVALKQQTFQLWLRAIGTVDARPIDGTEGAAFPFWSPDSKSIAFFSGGKLRRVGLAGGPPVTLCDAAGGRGGSWSPDNVIVFSPGTSAPLQRVSAAGGSPKEASVLDSEYGETSHRFPWFLPDGRHFLFLGSVGTCCPAGKDGRIRIGVLDSMEAPTLMTVESMASYAFGHLLFQREGTLMAQSFDPASRAFTGDPFPVVEGVGSEGSRYASFSASDTGVLVYTRGRGRANTQLTWFDRSGHQLGRLGAPDLYLNLGLSFDDSRIVAAVGSRTGAAANRSVWLIDAATAARTRLTFDNTGDNAPLFSSDGQRVVLTRVSRPGFLSLLQKPVTGIGTEDVILESRTAVQASDWTPDGRIIYSLAGAGGTSDIWIVPPSRDQKPSAYLASASPEGEAVLSPNGKWMAYHSSVDGQQAEVYVQSSPVGAGKFQISQGGGQKPLWRRDGKELYYLSPNADRLMAAAIDSSENFRHWPPVPLFPVQTLIGLGPVGRQYAVTRDGQRFLINVPEQQTATTPLTVVLNWLAVQH